MALFNLASQLITNALPIKTQKAYCGDGGWDEKCRTKTHHNKRDTTTLHITTKHDSNT
jgi:hypothetical protein